MKLLFKDNEDGFTTVGAAVAMLLVLALLFTAMQAYWVGTRSGQVQYVADAAALAGDNVVAEYITYGQAVDAALLSFSLVTVVIFGISAVAAFIPGGQGVAADLASAGEKVLRARNKFASTAEKGLNAAQKALPALCVAQSAQVISSNSDASGVSYVGATIPLPLEGEEVSLSDEGALDNAMQQVEDMESQVEQDAEAQKDAQDAADAAKYQGWLADCGSDAVNSCMRERAAKLAGLSGGQNPNYSSVDTWSWSAALSRARNYYRARYDQEAGAGYAGTPEEIGQSVARKRFYSYALETLNSRCSVTTSASGENPHFVELARNVADIKSTSLYTESVYPLSSDGSSYTIHAYTGCPVYCSQTSAGTGAVSAIDSGSAKECEQCKFSVTTLGRVPSASTSISNGFEYHYKRLVEAATACSSAMDKLDESTSRLQEETNGLKEILGDTLKEIVAKRYDPQPPGRYGCISIVYAGQTAVASSSSFTTGEVSIGSRMAISGATLAADPDTSQANVVSAIGCNLIPSESVGSGILKTVFGVWGTLLQAYCSGIDGIGSAFKSALSVIPLAGTSMSEWASNEFEDAFEKSGFQPPDLKAYKPVLVNTSHILKKDDSAVCSAIGNLKNAAGLVGVDAAQNLSNALGQLGLPSIETDVLGEGYLNLGTVDLELFGIGVGSVDLKFPVPDGFLNTYQSTLSQLESCLGGS